jgi:CRP/FNR family cyclic AMP-dependent transcriptional regulator
LHKPIHANSKTSRTLFMSDQFGEEKQDKNALRFTFRLDEMIILRDAACEIVRSKGWLSHTPRSFQREVLERCRLEQFKAGTPIYSIGDKPRGMFGVVAGCLSISLVQGSYTAHFAIPGSWFGEVSAFTRQPQRLGLTATRDTVLLHLPLRAFNEIVRNNPSTRRLFSLVTIGHLHNAIGGSDDLMIRNHVKRFVAILLRAGDCRHASPRSRGPVEIDINHEDLAHMANVARTTAGAILRKLEADGHLVLAYRRISILAPYALRKMLLD